MRYCEIKSVLLEYELDESPISNIDLMGPSSDQDFDQGTGFGKADRTIIKSPKQQERLVRAFANTPFLFNIVFKNTDAVMGDDDRDLGNDNENIDDRVSALRAGIHDSYEDIIGKQGVITVVMVANLSPRKEKMPMTPWTLAHKIGHSFQDMVYTHGWRGLSKVYAEHIMQINSILHTSQDPFQGGDAATGAFNYRGDMRSMLTMKSARTEKLTNPFEFFAEVVAQYLIAGKVTLNLPAERKEECEAKLNAALFGLLKSVEGKVVVEI